MEPLTAFAARDGVEEEAAPAAAGVELEELPMPAAPGKASMRTRLGCIALLSAAAVMASVFVGTPLAESLHAVLYPFLLDAVLAAAITTEVALTVVYVILRTENRTG